jgi:hypothetical protein
LLLTRNEILGNGDRAFRDLIEVSGDFSFGAESIRQIRLDFKSLIGRLSKIYLESKVIVKQEKKKKAKDAAAADTKALGDSVVERTIKSDNSTLENEQNTYEYKIANTGEALASTSSLPVGNTSTFRPTKGETGHTNKNDFDLNLQANQEIGRDQEAVDHTLFQDSDSEDGSNDVAGDIQYDVDKIQEGLDGLSVDNPALVNNDDETNSVHCEV